MVRNRITPLLFSPCVVLLFVLVCFGIAGAEDNTHSTGNQAVHSGSSQGSTESPHAGDRSGDLTDLLYRFMNFALLVIILFMLLRKSPVKGFFADRSEEIRQRIEDLEKDRKEAEARYRDVEQQLKDFEGKRKDIIDQFIKEGLQEKDKIIDEAKKRVGHIIEQSELSLRQEIQAVRNRLKMEIVDLSAQKAQRIIQENMDEEDQYNLINEFLKTLEKRH